MCHGGGAPCGEAAGVDVEQPASGDVRRLVGAGDGRLVVEREVVRAGLVGVEVSEVSILTGNRPAKSITPNE